MITMTKFSHLNKRSQPSIVDVGKKDITRRTATARCVLALPEEVLKELQKDNFKTKKGSVFQTAIIAGIMAAKKTGELIPLCHPLGLENCDVDIELNGRQDIVIYCT